MAQSLYRKYFEIVPVNNITTFSVNSGVDQISFLIPAVPGATLNTRDLVFSGNLLINKDDGSAYAPGEYETIELAMDTVNGVHNMISRIDITSMGSGNALIEQRRNYALINKYRRGTLSENDLVNGKYNNQHLCSNNAAGVQNFLGRTSDALAPEFAIQLNTGFLMDNIQNINLGAANGIMIKIYLSEVANALFNIDPSAAAANKLNANFNIQIQNAKLFGRYNFVTQPLLQQLNQVDFRKINDLVSVAQSSNDTLADQPMVRSLHKIVHIFQPNDTTNNNVDANNTATNQLVGLKQYQISNNGTRHPYNYEIEINPPIQDLNANDGNQARVAGNAEQCYLLISALNSQYPPVHSLVNARNQADALDDQEEDENNTTLNVNGIAVDYSYGFRGFSVPMVNNLLQLNVESALLTTDPIVPTTIRDQTATHNAFIEFDSSLSYQGMQVSQ
jgi:hypothetical protein